MPRLLLAEQGAASCFTDHVLVEMEMEITDLQNSVTEGNTQKPDGNIPENLNAM